VPVEAAPAEAQEGAALEQWREAIGKLDEALGPSPQQAFATERELSVPTEQLPPPSHAPEPREPDREAPPRPRRKRAVAILIALDIIALAVVILLLVRPHFSFFPPKGPAPSGMTQLSLEEPPGSTTVVRGKDFSLDLRASGGSPPLSWKIQEGSLPSGLSLNSTTGRIEGAPVTSGLYIFLVRTTDSAGQRAERAIAIEVVEPPVSNPPQQESAGAKSPESSVQPEAGGASQNETATGTIPSNPRSCPSNAFTLDRYGDLLTGELIWTGALSPGGRLEVRNLRASPAGSVRGDILPKGVPVRLTVTPGGILVTTSPAAANCWDARVVLLNVGSSQQSEIRIKWEVFQP